ncbi:hypothetical protein acsn021_38900 [Anaerocolumna cellulosilytica]|uniref:Uncharacterized protein n=1 Tax=Anaerocolumna cellulosilytica TaxID=433286 RepID=A0A6S6RC36_9FIRM|nr:hypothetical protein [Anaerocolumna cellulosilytica]BCJ96321.1 hypothetical protein acsn021_38900 [Anaerocolumna cellulosilytica]
MNINYKVQVIYDEQMEEITSSPKKWQEVLRLAGQLYRYEFDNVIMIYAQRPQSTLVADYDTWKMVERYVKRGSKGIAIFPSQALNPRMRYVFDISDTGGRDVKLTWDLEGENLKCYLDFLAAEGQIEKLESTSRDELKNLLKLFTGTNVWTIIKEEFSERLHELKQLSGSVIKEFAPDDEKDTLLAEAWNNQDGERDVNRARTKREGLQQQTGMEELLYRSVMYAVGTRCGFDLSMEEQDFSQIVTIQEEEIVYRLGSLVCDVSCSVLKEFSRNLKTIEKQTNWSGKRRNAYYGKNDVSRSGGSTVSGYSGDVGAGANSKHTGQVRKNGDGLSQGESEEPVQFPLPIWEADREDESGGRRGEPTTGSVNGILSKETQATESFLNHGNVEASRTGENAGGGSSITPGGTAFSLKKESENIAENEVGYEEEKSPSSTSMSYIFRCYWFRKRGQD